MHCVVNELGKGMLHKANTIRVLRWLRFGQCGTGKRGEVEGLSVNGQRVLRTICAVTEGWAAVWGRTVRTPEPVCLHPLNVSPVLAQKLGCKRRRP